MATDRGITVEQLAEAIQLAVNHTVVGDYTVRIPGWIAGEQAHLQLEVEHESGVVVQTFILDIEEDH